MELNKKTNLLACWLLCLCFANCANKEERKQTNKRTHKNKLRELLRCRNTAQQTNITTFLLAWLPPSFLDGLDRLEFFTQRLKDYLCAAFFECMIAELLDALPDRFWD
eukprot:5723875-Lingulodinium_polyedra.AAC.1